MVDFEFFIVLEILMLRHIRYFFSSKVFSVSLGGVYEFGEEYVLLLCFTSPLYFLVYIYLFNKFKIFVLKLCIQMKFPVNLQ